MRIHNEEKLKEFLEHKKINVAIFTDAYYPLVGGASSVVESLTTALMPKCNVVVITGDSKKYADNSPYPVIRCKGIDLGKNIGNFALPGLDGKLKKVLSTLNIDIVHIHSVFSLANFGLKFARKHNIPVCATGHSKFYEEYYNYCHSKLIAKILTKKAIKFINKCDLVCPVSNTLCGIYTARGVRIKMAAIQNATDFTFLADGQKVREVAKKYNIDQTKDNILFLSRITKIKNIEIIFDAVKILYQENKNIRLTFVGHGEDMNYYQDYADKSGLRDITNWTGVVTDKIERQALYQACDVFAFPSLVDSCGLVKYEAASQKTPTVCIKNSAVAEDITNGFTGYTAENNAECYAAALSDALSDKEKLKQIGQNAYDNILLTWNDIADKYIEQFNLLINKNKR